jgi:hypothetical protein
VFDQCVTSAVPVFDQYSTIFFGSYEGMTLSDAKFRAMFTREAVLKSDWYHQRLTTFRDRC